MGLCISGWSLQLQGLMMELMLETGSTLMELRGLFTLMGLPLIIMAILSCVRAGIGLMGRIAGPAVVMRLTIAGVRARISAGAVARSHYNDVTISRITSAPQARYHGW